MLLDPFHLGSENIGKMRNVIFIFWQCVDRWFIVKITCILQGNSSVNDDSTLTVTAKTYLFREKIGSLLGISKVVI